MESITRNGVVFDVGSLYAHFQSLKDNRKPKGLRYRLVDILVMMVMAKICGEDTPSGIADWVKHRSSQFKAWLKLERETMPHHSTYRRICETILDVEALERIVSALLSEKRYFGKQVLLSMDGKVLRGTLDDEQKGTYLLAAYLPTEGIVLMEVAIDGKGSEIPGAPHLLGKVDLRNKIVMGDALHTQRAVSIQIVEGGGEYIWIAKGNQPLMEENIRLWFEPEPDPIPGSANLPKDFEVARKVSKGHGRLEERTITVSSQLNDFLDWPYLEQVFKLERRATTLKTGKIQEHTVYGFTSLSREEIEPKNLLDTIRSYWGIENGLHYRRDVTLKEDRIRMTKGKAGQVMACLNNLVLGLLIGKQKFRYLPDARRLFAAHPDQAFALISRL
ncbi:MAG: ISAs1 family transposase [Anaerolineales bacterium]|jgi:predicted transposase YbfD/YdcC|nr:ISAs1 family transposase [Anaerolineales bacterium]